MHVSNHFNITRAKQDDWFNAILNNDTPLFVDPFLIFNETKGFWSDAHDLIINHFEQAFLLIAEGNLKPNSLPYKKALSLLLFREPNEFCLGYTAKGVAGSITAPDSNAQRRADDTISKRNATSNRTASIVLKEALRANTIFPSRTISGNIYFPRKKGVQMIVAVKVNGIFYSVFYKGTKTNKK